MYPALSHGSQTTDKTFFKSLNTCFASSAAQLRMKVHIVLPLAETPEHTNLIHCKTFGPVRAKYISAARKYAF
jgi:hypothetical protein